MPEYLLDLTTLDVDLDSVTPASAIFKVITVPSDPNFVSIVIKYRQLGTVVWSEIVDSLPILVNDLITLPGLLPGIKYEAYVIGRNLLLDDSAADEIFTFVTQTGIVPAFEPVIERILDNIVTVLTGIIQGTSYFKSFVQVTRDQIAEYEQLNLPCCLVYCENTDELGIATPQVHQVKAHIVLECHYRAYKDVDSEAEYFIHDVKKALMIDDSRGGLAINTEVHHTERFHSSTSKERGLALVFVEVTFRHNRLDPSEVRC